MRYLQAGVQVNRLALLAIAFMLSHIAVASANPQGGTVIAGTATISSAGATLTVNQTTGRAVIDWNSFNIGSGETTNFVAPSATSMTLNRIGDKDPSQIFGTLTSNGKIFLVNPNGFIFGKGSTVDVGGIVASASGIHAKDFMKGTMSFNIAGAPGAKIVLDGIISAKDAGLAGFVAPEVENNGIITARVGKVILASGETMTLDMYGDNLVSLAVTNDKAKHAITNNGLIAADGGSIALTAAAGRQVANGIISNAGILQANAIGTKNGKITLYAEGTNAVAGNIAANKGKKSGSSHVFNSGEIDVSGYNAGETGGAVTVTGDNVALSSSSVISASGRNGGGDIRIGGEYLGGGSTAAALNVDVASGATIFNDAVDSGNGGRTTIWSDGNTSFYGNIYARGGWQNGDGGFVETSGHNHLDAGGNVDLTAPNGNKGLYFLDPADITIYGNVDPAFVSTDGSLNLSSSLVLWMDSSDRSKITLTYDATGLGGATATGIVGTNTLTTSASIAASITAGARIRLGGTGTAGAASTLGTNTYTVASVSGTTITTVEALTANYTTQSVYRGLATQWADKSGQGNNTSSAITLSPLWVGNARNGNDVLRFDGTDDIMTVADSNSLDNTSGLSIFTTNTPLFLDGVNPAPIVSKRQSNDIQDAYSLFYYTGSQLNVDIDNTNNRFASPGAYTAGVTNIFGLIYDGTLSLASRAALYGGDALIKTATENSTSIPNYSSGLYLGGLDPTRGAYEKGDFQDVMIYRSALSATARTVLDQYQSAKWNVALSAPGTGATEAAKATSATGYSVFTTRYLERLAQTADISLQATNTITLDLKGDTLNFATAGRNLSLNAGTSITATSNGGVTTNGGNITMTAGTTLDTSKLTLNAGSGTVNLTSAGAMTLGNASAATFSARTTGAADITIASGKTLTATGTGNALTLASGRNFINNSGSGALSASNGRWLVYSQNPANDTTGGIASTFHRYSCTFGGSCPAKPATGNGFLYSYTPMLTATPNGVGITYGDAAPTLAGYGYGLSGYLAGDAALDSVSGSLNGATTYAQYNNTGTYNINYASGSLASALGYGFSYANNLTGLSVGAAALNIAGKALTKTYGDTYGFSSADYVVTGLKGSDSVTSVTQSSAGAAATSNVSSYAVSLSGASGSGLSNYTVSYTSGTLDVTPATLTIAANALTKIYGDTYSFGSADYSVTGLRNSDAVSSVTLGSGGAAATANVNTYAVTASGATGTGLGNYTVNYTNGTMAVTPVNLTIAAGTLTKVYGDSYAFGSTDYSVSGLKNSDAVSAVTLASSGSVATANVGTYGVSASGATGTGLGNYTISYTDGSLDVTPATINIAAGALTKVYGDTYSFGGTDYSVSGLKNSDAVSTVTLASSGRADTANVGAYGVTASGAAGTGLGNYNINYTDGTLAVTPASLNIAVGSITKIYGDTYGFGATDYAVSGLKNSDNVSAVTITSAGAAATANVNTYSATASGAMGTGLGNYTVTYIDGSLAVTPASLTIAVGALNKVYGDAYSFGSGDYSVSGLRNSDAVSSVSLASGGAAATAGVNAYGVSASGASGSGLGNYNINYTAGTLDVTKANLTLTATDQTKAFGNIFNFNGGEFTTSGLKNTDNVSSADFFSRGAGVTAAPGSYHIHLHDATGTGLDNYNITYVMGHLTVTPSALTATLSTYADASFTPEQGVNTNTISRPLIEFTPTLGDILGIAPDQRTLFSLPAP